MNAFFGLFTGKTADKWGWLDYVDMAPALHPVPPRPADRGTADVTRTKTMFEKVWDQHQVIAETADTPAVLYIDLHLIHEVTSPQAFYTCCVNGTPGAPN